MRARVCACIGMYVCVYVPVRESTCMICIREGVLVFAHMARPRAYVYVHVRPCVACMYLCCIARPGIL